MTEFAMIPVVYSLIPDLAPERERVATNLAFAALMAAGSSAGFYFGSAILADATAWIPGGIEPWRKAMLFLAAAGLPLLIAGTATIEPTRGVRSDAEAAIDLPGFLRECWRAVGLFVGVAGLLLVAVQALGPLAALALERCYRPDLAMLGHALGIITLAATLGCLPLAG